MSIKEREREIEIEREGGGERCERRSTTTTTTTSTTTTGTDDDHSPQLAHTRPVAITNHRRARAVRWSVPFRSDRWNFGLAPGHLKLYCPLMSFRMIIPIAGPRGGRNSTRIRTTVIELNGRLSTFVIVAALTTGIIEVVFLSAPRRIRYPSSAFL